MSLFGDFDKIKVGDVGSLSKLITEEDIKKFVDMTGDDNPLHVDGEYASKTPFKDVVVHGMLGASFISTVIGTKLPGSGALWVSQSMNFLLPVRLDDEIEVTCTVTKKQESQRFLELDTIIRNQEGQVVLDGKGVVRVLQTKEIEENASALDELPQVALVTGGSGGIGSAIAKKLASEGYKVVVNYNKNKRAAEKLVKDILSNDQEAVAIQAEISCEENAKLLIDKVERTFGHVTVLVNNASPRINPKIISDMAWADFQKHIDVQVKGAFLLSQQVIPFMADRKYGRIINITSQVVGIPTLHWTAYGLAKSALSSMSRYMALELGPKKITVNCIAPGMTETSLIGDISEKSQLMVARQTPLRSLALPGQIADAVAFIASDKAGHMTGHTLHINGGNFMV